MHYPYQRQLSCTTGGLHSFPQSQEKYDTHPSKTVLYRPHEKNHLGSKSRSSMKTLRKIVEIKPALSIIENYFTASAKQAIAATSRLSSHIDSLKSSKLRSVVCVITGKSGRANFLRNATLLTATMLYDKKSLQNYRQPPPLI